MNWKIIGITFGFMVLGYLIGSVLNSVWITKFLGLEDVRKKGSMSVGATNVNRVHGKLIGLIVFVLDVCKPIMTMAITNIAVGPDQAVIQAVALATVLGHIFPIFHNFKGGKGAACMLGFIIIANWTLFFISALIFFSIVIPTKKVSLGSMGAPPLILIIYIGLSQISGYNSKIFELITYKYSYWINVVTLAIIILFVVYAHRANIKRLINKTEIPYKLQ